MQACTAKFFSFIVSAYCEKNWPDSYIGMESHCAGTFGANSMFNVVCTGSHKYVPSEELNTALGLPQGGGVYGYIKFHDGSYCLLTCGDVGLAVWDGKDPSTAELFHQPLTEKDWENDVARWERHLGAVNDPDKNSLRRINIMGPKAIRELQEKWGERGTYFS